MVKRLSKPPGNKPLGKPLKKAVSTTPGKKGKSLVKPKTAAAVVIKSSATSSKPLAKPTKPPVEPMLARTGVTGPIPTVPKKFKWKGKKDPYFKKEGVLMVLPKDMPKGWPKLHKNAPPDTWWRIDPKGKRKPSLVTLLPDGVYTGWDTCHTCNNIAYRCPCPNGVLHGRGVEWVWISQKLRVDDVDYVGKGTGQVDATQPAVRERALHHYKGRETAAYVPQGIMRSTGRPLAQSSAERPADRVSGKPKTLSKTKGLSKPVKKAASKKPSKQAEVIDLDLVKLGKDAERAAAASTKEALAKIEGRKRLDDLVAASKKPAKKTLSKSKGKGK